jgi:hypothetical protein
MTIFDVSEVSETLRSLRPDRGNLYASRTVRTKGVAAFQQWQETCRAFAAKFPTERRAAEFLVACGMNER